MKRGIKSLGILLLFLFCLSAILNGTNKGEQLKESISQWLNSIRSKRIGDLQVSPDQKWLAFTLNQRVEENKSKTTIWLLNTKTNKMMQFTSSIKSDRSPRWSPISKSLAFLSNRDKKRQIYIIRRDGGEAELLFESETNIRSFAWSASGRQIAFLAADKPPKEEEKKKKERDDTRIADQLIYPARLRIFNLDTKKITTLTNNSWRIQEFIWGNKKDQLLVTATNHPQPELLSHQFYTISIQDRQMKRVVKLPLPFSGMRLSPDGKILAFHGPRVDGPSPFDIYLVTPAGKNLSNLTGKLIDRSVDRFIWLPNNQLLSLSQKGFVNQLHLMTREAKIIRKIQWPIFPSRNFVMVGNNLYFVGHKENSPSELWLARNLNQPKKLSHFNDTWPHTSMVKPQLIKYRSFDNLPIEASLFQPTAKASSPGPAIILVHGGPSGRFSMRFNTWAQLLVKQGYTILCPNIRGSTGYGYEFMAANRYDWGGADFKDVMAGIDYLLKHNKVDPNRIGIGGWSYGGYMSAWAVTQTQRFKAAVSGAPMTDLAFEYGAESSSINAYDTWYMGTPYEDLKLFIERSPVTFVKNVKTPTLILCGEKDEIDPIGQCWQYYRGLKRYGVKTQLIIYPREGHGIREEKHRLDLFYRIVKWFNTHLK